MKSIVLHEPDLSSFVSGKKSQIRLPYLHFQRMRAALPGDPGPDCPYGTPGTICRVKEAWRETRATCEEPYSDVFVPTPSKHSPYEYLSDVHPLYATESGIWNRAELMPDDATRYFLQIDSVRLEKLNDISISDAILEGMPVGLTPEAPADLPIMAFAAHWEGMYGAASWITNPTVWVIGFHAVSRSALKP